MGPRNSLQIYKKILYFCGALGSFLGLALTLSSCTKTETEDRRKLPDIPEKPVDSVKIAAGHVDDSRFEFLLTVKDNGILITFKNIPINTEIKCTFDGTPLTPCHDGALLAKPSPGEHGINAIATRKPNGETVEAIMRKFTIAAPLTDPLLMSFDMVDFKDGMALKTDKDLQIKVKFAANLDCTPVLKCSIDAHGSPFWHNCTAKDGTKIPKAQLAKGIQTFAIQAQCGDRLGPVLESKWYGVPATYQPLMLQDIKDAKKRHLITLYRNLDCAEQPIFQCAKPGSTVFETCANLLDNPPAKTKIRVNCAGTFGPALSF